MASAVRSFANVSLSGPPLAESTPPHIPEYAAEKLKALVRAALTNIDRFTLLQALARAYRMGSRHCHQSMTAAYVETETKTLAEIERNAIERTYSMTGGDVDRTAEILSIGRTTLYRKLRSYGVVAVNYRHCPSCGCDLRDPKYKHFSRTNISHALPSR